MTRNERDTDGGDGTETEVTDGRRRTRRGASDAPVRADGGGPRSGLDPAEELRRQDERLERFASVVSHDLRNPLNVAMGRAQLLEADCDSEHVEPVLNSLDRMEALIADAVDLAREGSVLTETEPVRLREAANATWSTIEAPDAELTVTGEIGLVESEESRVNAVFRHVFENALKHAGTDVSIEVGTLDDGFYVADDGPGIDPEDREQALECGFSTVQDGTGLGLTVVRDVATAHGWDLTLTESEHGGLRLEFHGLDLE